MKSVSLIKKLGAIILTIALFVQTFHNELIWADYLLETNSYAAMCVNTDKPEMHCNGLCQMASKMKHADDQDRQAPQLQVKTADIVLYFEDAFRLTPVFILDESRNYAELPVLKTKDFQETVLHPPVVA